MWFYKEVARFMVGWCLMFVAGYIHPLAGVVVFALFLALFVPRFWRACTMRNAEVQLRRRKQNIETQILRGRQDAELLREVAEDIRSRRGPW